MRVLKFIFILVVLLPCGGCTRSIKSEIKEIYEDGSPKLINYYDVKQSGIMVKQMGYYPNKQLRIEGNFLDGEKHGKWVYYYQSGIIWSKGYFKQGKMDGRTKTYYPNGQLNVKGSYNEGTRVGKWYFYDENGKRVKQINYDD